MLHTRTTEVCREHSDWAQARSFTVQKKKKNEERKHPNRPQVQAKFKASHHPTVKSFGENSALS